jgi:hypothetical protein
MILVHTHPCAEDAGSITFSGDPASFIKTGDVLIPATPWYDSIYLLAPDGSLKQYRGVGTDVNQATTHQELHDLKAVSTDIPKPAVRYLVDPVAGGYFPVYTS